MSLLSWLAGVFSSRGKALSMCKRGMRRARKHDRAGAIGDYSAVIGMPGVPADVRAMALYNRALVHSAAGDDIQATGDLDSILAMTETLINVKTSARQKLARMSHQRAERRV
jgi:hypothetical protein